MPRKKVVKTVELLAHRVPGPNEMHAYERVLSDALAGDRTLFAREDYVEEAWRIVEPVVKSGTPLYRGRVKTRMMRHRDDCPGRGYFGRPRISGVSAAGKRAFKP
jgi:Glucose-6-phosphate dehydrogenase, C-terminal domain